MKPTVYIDPHVTIEEHHGVQPVSYMAYSNTVNMLHDLMEIMQMMNNCDDLPQWVDQSLAEAADRVAKSKRYIMSEKSKGGQAVGEPLSFPAYVPSGVDGSGSYDVAPSLACSCGCDACGAGTCHCPADCACGCRADGSIVDYQVVTASDGSNVITEILLESGPYYEETSTMEMVATVSGEFNGQPFSFSEEEIGFAYGGEDAKTVASAIIHKLSDIIKIGQSQQKDLESLIVEKLETPECERMIKSINDEIEQMRSRPSSDYDE